MSKFCLRISTWGGRRECDEEEDLNYYKDAFKGMMRGGRACVEIDQSFWGGGGGIVNAGPPKRGKVVAPAQLLSPPLRHAFRASRLVDCQDE